MREMTSAPKGAWPLSVDRTERRGSNIERDAVAIARSITRFDRDQVLAREHGGDAKSRLAKNLRERTEHGHAGDHVVPFLRKSFLEARDIAALVLHRRFGELQVHLAHVGVEDDQAAEAHRRRLRHAQKLGHLACHVLVDARLARKTPSIGDLCWPQLPVIRGFGIGPAADDAHLALAARATTAARRIDGQADPVRGAEHGRPGRHARRAVEREVGDLELALDHRARAAACSARRALPDSPGARAGW